MSGVLHKSFPEWIKLSLLDFDVSGNRRATLDFVFNGGVVSQNTKKGTARGGDTVCAQVSEQVTTSIFRFVRAPYTTDWRFSNHP